MLGTTPLSVMNFLIQIASFAAYEVAMYSIQLWSLQWCSACNISNWLPLHSMWTHIQKWIYDHQHQIQNLSLCILPLAILGFFHRLGTYLWSFWGTLTQPLEHFNALILGLIDLWCSQHSWYQALYTTWHTLGSQLRRHMGSCSSVSLLLGF